MTNDRVESEVHEAHRVRPVPVRVAADGTLHPCPLTSDGDTTLLRVEFWTGWCDTCHRVTSDLPMPGTDGITDEDTARALVGEGHWSAWEHWLTRLHQDELDTARPAPARIYGRRISPVLAAWGAATR